MLKNNIIIKSLRKTLNILPKKFKRKALISSLLLFLNSILDLAGLASLLPLFSLILQDDFVEKNKQVKLFYDFFGFSTETNFIIFIAIVIVVFSILKNITSLFIVKYHASFSFSVMRFGMRTLHRKYYNKGFQYFQKTNSNVTLRDIYTIPFQFASTVIMSLLLLLNEFVVLLLILISILLYNYKIVLLLFVTVLPVFLFFYGITKKKIKLLGEETNRLIPQIGKSMFQSIFGYVDVTITGTKEYFLKKVRDLVFPFSIINIKKNIYNNTPTKVIESTMILSIVLMLLYGLFFFDSKESIVSLLAIFGLAAYRVMPSINRIMIALNSIIENQYTFNVMSDINKEEKEIKINEIPLFSKKIFLENISFKYGDNQDHILKNFSLEVKKGDIIGIKGKSGSGKTTLINIMLGLLSPTKGKIFVDKTEIDEKSIVSWQKQLGYVRQDVYILDATVAENIAFGVEKKDIDYEKIEQVIKLASLKDFINSLPQKVKTNVGERGTQLSGGQKQRIGIARALYFGAKVLFFDEATSALDSQTENEITESIKRLSGKGLTIIIIAHRETSLNFANRIIEM